ncbi:hypothetical protein [Microcella flavibacter]|uniref:hypothetical protein n=1 Tax=Microcella flavibacter TaxID=1804990 RepID=UPI001457465B|nr:hypothetical protein [Microcella flavibacter]
MSRFDASRFLSRLGPRSPQPVEYCATIVVRSAVTKLDALAIVALAVDRPVENQRTMRPQVPLAEGAWVEIEIPKFGEPPPLAIDVYSTVSDDHARLQALTLLATLEEYTGWSIRPDFTL